MMGIEVGRVYCEDNLELMKRMEDCSVDLIVTDPPFGIKFMGKNWDKALPSIETWQECLRVLKPGGFAFVMSGPRQDCLARNIINLEDAGFVVSFSSIYWAFASGFPKGQNISKKIDKRFKKERKVIGKYQRPDGTDRNYGNWKRGDGTFSKDSCGFIDALKGSKITKSATPEAKSFDGNYSGCQLKPAVEIVIVCQKPITGKTYIDQALAYYNEREGLKKLGIAEDDLSLHSRQGLGGLWLDEGKIPINEIEPNNRPNRLNGINFKECSGMWKDNKSKKLSNIQDLGTLCSQGRFPANLLVSDSILDDGNNRPKSGRPNCIGKLYKTGFDGEIYGKFNPLQTFTGKYLDSGSFSRYFSLDKWFEEKVKTMPESVQRTFPFLITPKAPGKEKWFWCKTCGKVDLHKNRKKHKDHDIYAHPTQKPLKLFMYLVTLGSREHDVVFDPFGGTGTLVVAAQVLGRKWIVCDYIEENCEIAEARIENDRVRQMGMRI